MADSWRASITSALRKGGDTFWVDATQLELVALRVPAKVVVIVENENARRGFALTIEISGLETADAAADDHEVVGLGRARRLQREIAVAELVRQLERLRMAAPQTGSALADSTSAWTLFHARASRCSASRARIGIGDRGAAALAGARDLVVPLLESSPSHCRVCSRRRCLVAGPGLQARRRRGSVWATPEGSAEEGVTVSRRQKRLFLHDLAAAKTLPPPVAEHQEVTSAG